MGAHVFSVQNSRILKLISDIDNFAVVINNYFTIITLVLKINVGLMAVKLIL